jgi:hypothetical protein
MSRIWVFATFTVVVVIVVVYVTSSCEGCANTARHFIRELFRALR